MILTEEEAKTKWCPFAHSYEVHGPMDHPVSLNRNSTGHPDKDCLCIGVACMAWRSVLGAVQPGIAAKHEGYCGIAGKP